VTSHATFIVTDVDKIITVSQCWVSTCCSFLLKFFLGLTKLWWNFWEKYSTVHLSSLFTCWIGVVFSGKAEQLKVCASRFRMDYC